MRTKALPPLFLPLVVSYGFLANKYIEIRIVDQRGFIWGEGGGWATKATPFLLFLPLVVSYWFLANKGKQCKGAREVGKSS